MEFLVIVLVTMLVWLASMEFRAARISDRGDADQPTIDPPADDDSRPRPPA